jgi:hypothetical protein
MKRTGLRTIFSRVKPRRRVDLPAKFDEGAAIGTAGNPSASAPNNLTLGESPTGLTGAASNATTTVANATTLAFNPAATQAYNSSYSGASPYGLAEKAGDNDTGQGNRTSIAVTDDSGDGSTGDSGDEFGDDSSLTSGLGTDDNNDDESATDEARSIADDAQSYADDAQQLASDALEAANEDPTNAAAQDFAQQAVAAAKRAAGAAAAASSAAQSVPPNIDAAQAADDQASTAYDETSDLSDKVTDALADTSNDPNGGATDPGATGDAAGAGAGSGQSASPDPNNPEDPASAPGTDENEGVDAQGIIDEAQSYAVDARDVANTAIADTASGNAAAKDWATKAGDAAKRAEDAAAAATTAAQSVPPDLGAAQTASDLALTADDDANTFADNAEEALNNSDNDDGATDPAATGQAAGAGAGSSGSAGQQAGTTYVAGARAPEHDHWHTWDTPVHISSKYYYVMDATKHQSGHPDHHWYTAYEKVASTGDSASSPPAQAPPAAAATAANPTQPPPPVAYVAGARAAEHDNWHTWSSEVHVGSEYYYVMDPSRHQPNHPDHHWYKAYKKVAATGNNEHSSLVDDPSFKVNHLAAPITDDKPKLEKLQPISTAGFPTQSTYGQANPAQNQPAAQPAGWGVTNVPPDPTNTAMSSVAVDHTQDASQSLTNNPSNPGNK